MPVRQIWPGSFVPVPLGAKSLDTSHPDCPRLVLNFLRYWITVGNDDWFQFDLAPHDLGPRLHRRGVG
jgi:hypothetical protein